MAFEPKLRARVANIRNGSGDSNNRLNTEFLIGANRDGQDVFDDGVADDLIGGSGPLDLFFARAGSDRQDRGNPEFLESL